MEPGAVVDRDFEVVKLAGRGSFSTVYEAHQRSRKNRRVALKVLHRGIQQSLEKQAGHVRNPYLKEQLLCQRLKDTSVCRVIKVGATMEGRYYVALEWAKGLTLDEYMKDHKKGLPTYLAADVIVQLGKTLGVMHKSRVIHRDLKPSNIMVQPRPDKLLVKVLDFGIAKLADEDELAGGEDALLVGTPSFMSPEAAAGLPTDRRSDIFSLAAIAYELLTGSRHIQLEYAHRNSQDYIGYLLSDKPIPSFPASASRPELPLEVDRALARALSRIVEHRPDGVEKFLEELVPTLHAFERPQPEGNLLRRTWRKLVGQS